MGDKTDSLREVDVTGNKTRYDRLFPCAGSHKAGNKVRFYNMPSRGRAAVTRNSDHVTRITRRSMRFRWMERNVNIT